MSKPPAPGGERRSERATTVAGAVGMVKNRFDNLALAEQRGRSSAQIVEETSGTGFESYLGWTLSGRCQATQLTE